MKDGGHIPRDRRAFLGNLLSLAAGTAVGGCSCLFRRKPYPVCPGSPDISLPDGPLLIDAHCHVFNGTDLQVRDFFSKVAVNQGGALGAVAELLGGLLQALAWSTAPDGSKELNDLQVIEDALRSCSEEDIKTNTAALRQKAYGQGRVELQAAVRTSDEFRVLQNQMRANALPQALDDVTAIKVDTIRRIEELPENIEDYHTVRGARDLRGMSLRSRSAAGVIDFALQLFQYRYVSVQDYLRTYNEPGTRVIDLMLPSLVDYDWWLSTGRATPTSLHVQVEIMQRVAILTGGRAHCFVPYDPLRQVAFDLGHAAEDSFALVADAIENRGCVGVKLYPPMGFAALGNSDLRGPNGTSFWAREWLPEWTGGRDIGNRLDNAMYKLFTWCQAEGVPIMAHTSISNGVTPEFEELAGSTYWENALRMFPNLRVSFGHFGDSSIVDDGIGRARGFTELMNARDGEPGTFAYADAGYFVEVMNSRPAMLANLRQLYDETAPKGRAALANRFMYGTDWEMTLVEGSVEGYFVQFVNLFEDFESRPALRAAGLSDLGKKFFGENAVDWIGLRKGDAARERLDAFYESNGVPQPDWAKKVDELTDPVG